jgi:hypothetical protein
VLRLWPDTLRVGLFMEQAWLSSMRSGKTSAVGGLVSGEAWDSALARLFEQATQPARRTQMLQLVSDEYARLLPLPWRSELSSHAERVAYARACFDHAGLPVGDGWVIHAEFRHAGALGLAYALPEPELARCATFAAERGMHLANVLPVSAVAHARGGRARRGECRLVVLAEAGRVSTLAFNERGLCLYDVEPVVEEDRDALDRLLRRVMVRFPSAAITLQVWTPGGSAQDIAGACTAYVDKSHIGQLALEHWGRVQ